MNRPTPPNGDMGELRGLLSRLIATYREPAKGLSEPLSFIECMEALTAREKSIVRDTIWNIMSVKTEGIYDDGDIFIKRAPIDQAIINMIGYEEHIAMQEAVDAQQPPTQTKDDDGRTRT